VLSTFFCFFFFVLLFLVGGPVPRSGGPAPPPPPAAGYLECGRAKVRWFLSVDRKDLPAELGRNQTSYRSVMVDGETVDFSDGFTDLHTASYQGILAGRGFGLEDVRPSIEIVSALRSGTPQPHRGEPHPLLAGCAAR
jgi:UDP-N-acetyl-2-amino-2-deoxyglucuronate dehydrogenase